MNSTYLSNKCFQTEFSDFFPEFSDLTPNVLISKRQVKHIGVNGCFLCVCVFVFFLLRFHL